uniref:DRIM domain-containing protein n=1 Tax=Trichuris muris TaxID=70415 RepID=A0A5S6QN15_TRIMR
MKSHRAENRFKFVGFSTRLKNIHVDVVRQAKPYAATPIDAETFFAKELESQSDLNYSLDFENFVSEIASLKLNTYALLLHHQKAIVAALKKHLTVARSHCLKSLLELTVAICRDLHEDFQPHLWEFFDIIVALLGGQECPEILECCFSAIAYLLKFSWRRLLNNMQEVFSHFEPLLSSRKEYVRRFAAEAMVFFIRKSPAFSEVIQLCLDKIERGDLTVDGFAELLVQCLLGTQHSFHSMAPKKLEELLKFLHFYRGNMSLTSELLRLVNGRLISHANTLSSPVIFDCICKNGVIFTDGSEAEKVYRSTWIAVISGWVAFKEGALLPPGKRSQLLEDVALPLLQAADMDIATLRSTVSLIAILFRSVDLLKNASAINSVLSALASIGPKFEHEVLALLEETIDLTGYHLCFSSFLCTYLSNNLCSEVASNDRLLVCLCRLLCMCECYFGIPFDSTSNGNSLWRKRFAQMKPNEVSTFLTSVVKYCAAISDDEVPLEWLPRLIGACLVFTCVLNVADVSEHLLQTAKQLFSKGFFAKKEHALTLGVLIQCLLPCSSRLVDSLPPETVLSDGRLDWNDPFVLRMVDLYLLHVLDSEHSVSVSLINASIERALESLLVPFHSVRMVSLNILRSLCSLANFEEGAKLVELCLEAECIPLSIAQYRNRLMAYKKAVTIFTGVEVPSELPSFGTLLLHFFAGQLRANFSLLWNPVLEHLEAVVRFARKEVTWPFLHRLLIQAEDGMRGDMFKVDSTLCFSEDESALASFVIRYATLPADFNSRIDSAGFRYHLWILMEKLSDIAVSHTETLSPLLTRALETELQRTGFVGLQFENLNAAKEDEEGYDDDDDDDDNMQIVENSESLVEADQDGQLAAKVDYRSLIAMIRVFANFKNCSAIYESDLLRQWYFKLLLHNRNDLQKVSLCCLFNYFDEKTIPQEYRNKLEALLDDKMFRERLVLLGDELLGEEADLGDLFTILIRLLYGRMQGKRGASRKGQVFAFLARCKQSYTTMFLELILGPLQEYMDSQPLNDLMNCNKFDKSVPFVLITKMFADLTDVVKRLGHRMEKRCQRMVFQVVMLLCTILQRICEAKSGLARYAFLRAKRLKKSALSVVALFLSHFPQYPFLSEELETLCSIVLWPSLVKEQQKVEFAAGLRDILVQCSCSARYWPLLICQSNADSDSAFSFIMRTLGCASLTPTTEDKILTIISNLLSLADDYPTDEPSILSSCKAFSEQHAFDVALFNPETTVMRYADVIVNYYTKKSSDRFLREERNLSILCRLAEKATACNDSLLTLLLRQIPRPSQDEDSEILVLQSALKLLRCTSSPADYMSDVVLLYNAVNRRKSKVLLNEAFSIVVAHDEDYRRLQAIVDGMSAWNPNQVEEPDYTCRLANHKLARQLLNETPCHKLPVCLRVLTCCCFDELKSMSDYSLRSNALSTLEVATSCLKSRLEQIDAAQLLSDLFLRQIKAGLKNNSETVRHDMVLLLRQCVLHFGTTNELAGLSQLLSKDEETDFFNNIRHIQVHHRARALRRLCDKLENPPAGFRPITAVTLSYYILPLALPVLKDPLLEKHTGYVDEVIRLIKCYCQASPWRRYSSFLMYYLKQLAEEKDKHKLLTKIIVAILDGFHFIVKGDASDPTVKGGSSTARQSAEVQENVAKVLLPKLKDALMSKSGVAKSSRHRTAKLQFADDEEQAIRVPIALAIVKLLHKLPEDFLASELSSVVLKVCSMLKSRSLDFRRFARKALYSIARTLGGRHLAAVIKDLKSVLSKGFQKHVLTFTVHGLLDSMKEDLSSTDVASCLEDVMQICKDELFGEIKEERKNEAVIRSVWEAKFSKAVRTFATLGELIDESSLSTVIEPLQEVIRSSANHEAIQCVAASLRELALGLSKNQTIPKEGKLNFAFQTLTEALPHTFEQRPVNDQLETPDDKPPRSDCYLLPPEPGRRGVAPKFFKKSNFHLLVSFGLEILWSLLKGGKLPLKDVESYSLLDPFIDPLATCLKTSYPNVVSKALRCLRSCVRYPLRSLEAAINGLSGSVFDLLEKYVGLGTACRGESFEVLAGSFKLIAAMIIHVDYFTLNSKEVEVLLRYVEEDLADVQKHAIAFSVVKAIICRHYLSDSLLPVVNKLKQLAIVASSDHIRDNCRLAIAKYVKCALKEQRLKASRLRQIVEFFCVQLSYTVETGRVSALEMIAWFVANLHVTFLSRQGCFLFVSLSARLVNDQSEKCRELAALALKSLVEKVDHEVRKDIIISITDWIKCEKVINKEVGALCLGLIFETSIGKASARKSILFAFALKETGALLGVKDKVTTGRMLQSRDRIIYLLLVACCKAIKSWPPEGRDAKLSKVRKRLLAVIDSALEYDHLWVRLTASQLLGYSMSLFNCAGSSSTTETEGTCPVQQKLSREDLTVLVSFCKKLLAHLADNRNSVVLAEQAAKNLVYIAKFTPEYSSGSLPAEEAEEADFPKLSLLWMAKRMARMCRFEVVSNSKSVIQRSYVFKWVAAISLGCHKDCLSFLLTALLPSLYREYNVGSDEKLKSLSVNVCEHLKQTVGLETFSEHWLQCRNFAASKLLIRKQRLAAQAVNDPVRAAKRKMRKHRSKTVSMKRRRLVTKATADIPQDLLTQKVVEGK